MTRAKVGQGIAKGGELGVVDMRQITPALARLLQVKLPDHLKCWIARALTRFTSVPTSRPVSRNLIAVEDSRTLERFCCHPRGLCHHLDMPAMKLPKLVTSLGM